MTAIINTRQSSYTHTCTHTYTHTHTHTSWWLVLIGWVTTKEYHPRLPFDRQIWNMERQQTYIIIIIIIIIIVRRPGQSGFTVGLASCARCSLVIMRNSLSFPKLLYTLRTAECSGRPALLQVDNILREGLSAILNIHLIDDQWIQTSLPVRNGGLGIRSATMLAPSAWFSSATGTSDLQNNILRSGLVALPDPSFQASFVVWTVSSATLAPTGQEAIKQRIWDSGIITASLTSLSSKVTDALSRTRLLAAQSAITGDWIYVNHINVNVAL